MKIPEFECRSGCSDCCGVVPFSDKEKRAAEQRAPLLMWERFSPTHWLLSGAVNTFRCPFIAKEGGCSIYDIRPSICRLFGAVEDPMMTCPYGCGPKTKLTNGQSDAILKRSV